MERFVRVADDVRLWVEDTGRSDGSPLLLVMGANASGLTWPDELIAALSEQHRVVRYDHRDTGKSTWSFEDHPYRIADLAADVIAILDALEIDRAHVLGMSMGGTLVQLLLLDAPTRLLSATLVATAALEGVGEDSPADIDPRLLELWEHMTDDRDHDAEIAWRVEHWRLLNGPSVRFDPEEFRLLEERIVHHASRHDNPAAHALADQSGLNRGAELASVNVPTLVIEGPADPINPPPAARRIAAAIPTAQLVTIDGLGHALGHPVVKPFAEAVLTFTAQVADDPPRR